MRKLFFILLFSIITLVSMSSCVATAYAQDDDIDVELVVRYGVPYYEGSIIRYYLYNGWYYYPYVINNRYFYHRYSRPLPPPSHRNHYVPNSGNHHRPNTTVLPNNRNGHNNFNRGGVSGRDGNFSNRPSHNSGGNRRFGGRR